MQQEAIDVGMYIILERDPASSIAPAEQTLTVPLLIAQEAMSKFSIEKVSSPLVLPDLRVQIIC